MTTALPVVLHDADYRLSFTLPADLAHTGPELLIDLPLDDQPTDVLAEFLARVSRGVPGMHLFYLVVRLPRIGLQLTKARYSGDQLELWLEPEVYQRGLTAYMGFLYSTIGETFKRDFPLEGPYTRADTGEPFDWKGYARAAIEPEAPPA